jgi:hypothetical protein
MKNTFKLSVITLIGVPLLISIEAQATIYKCVNATTTKVHYNDKPCAVTEIEKQFKAVKDPVGGYIPPAFVKDQENTNNKGVVVGDDGTGNQQYSSNLKQSRNEEQAAMQPGGSYATGNNLTQPSSDNQSIDSSSSSTSSSKSRIQKSVSGILLPSVPLKVEKNAKEPRAKIK